LCQRKPGKARGIIVDEEKEPGEDGRYKPLDQYNKFIWEIPEVTPELAMLTVDERKQIIHAIYAARQGPLICKHCEEDADEIPYFCEGCLAGLVQCAATALNRGKKMDFTSTPGFYPLKMAGNQSYSKIWQRAKKHWNALEPLVIDPPHISYLIANGCNTGALLEIFHDIKEAHLYWIGQWWDPADGKSHIFEDAIIDEKHAALWEIVRGYQPVKNKKFWLARLALTYPSLTYLPTQKMLENYEDVHLSESELPEAAKDIETWLIKMMNEEEEHQRATYCQLCTRFIANEATGLCALHDI
jgi:hypothetical protein